MEPISHIALDFYNGALYRIVVVYDEKTVEGLTEEDGEGHLRAIRQRREGYILRSTSQRCLRSTGESDRHGMTRKTL